MLSHMMQFDDFVIYYQLYAIYTAYVAQVCFSWVLTDAVLFDLYVHTVSLGQVHTKLDGGNLLYYSSVLHSVLPFDVNFLDYWTVVPLIFFIDWPLRLPGLYGVVAFVYVEWLLSIVPVLIWQAKVHFEHAVHKVIPVRCKCMILWFKCQKYEIVKLAAKCSFSWLVDVTSGSCSRFAFYKSCLCFLQWWWFVLRVTLRYCMTNCVQLTVPLRTFTFHLQRGECAAFQQRVKLCVSKFWPLQNTVQMKVMRVQWKNFRWSYCWKLTVNVGIDFVCSVLCKVAGKMSMPIPLTGYD